MHRHHTFVIRLRGKHINLGSDSTAPDGGYLPLLYLFIPTTIWFLHIPRQRPFPFALHIFTFLAGHRRTEPPASLSDSSAPFSPAPVLAYDYVMYDAHSELAASPSWQHWIGFTFFEEARTRCTLRSVGLVLVFMTKVGPGGACSFLHRRADGVILLNPYFAAFAVHPPKEHHGGRRRGAEHPCTDTGEVELRDGTESGRPWERRGPDRGSLVSFPASQRSRAVGKGNKAEQTEYEYNKSPCTNLASSLRSEKDGSRGGGGP